MAHGLKMAVHASIQALYLKGLSQRRIAFELGVDRGTVARCILQLAIGSNTAIAPTGSKRKKEEEEETLRDESIGSEPNTIEPVKGSHDRAQSG